MVDLGGDQQCFKRLWRGEQAVGRIGDESAFFALRRVPMPASRPSADQLEVAGKAVFLVVQ